MDVLTTDQGPAPLLLFPICSLCLVYLTVQHFSEVIRLLLSSLTRRTEITFPLVLLSFTKGVNYFLFVCPATLERKICFF